MILHFMKTQNTLLALARQMNFTTLYPKLEEISITDTFQYQELILFHQMPSHRMSPIAY